MKLEIEFANMIEELVNSGIHPEIITSIFHDKVNNFISFHGDMAKHNDSIAELYYFCDEYFDALNHRRLDFLGYHTSDGYKVLIDKIQLIKSQ